MSIIRRYESLDWFDNEVRGRIIIFGREWKGTRPGLSYGRHFPFNLTEIASEWRLLHVFNDDGKDGMKELSLNPIINTYVSSRVGTITYRRFPTFTGGACGTFAINPLANLD